MTDGARMVQKQYPAAAAARALICCRPRSAPAIIIEHTIFSLLPHGMPGPCARRQELSQDIGQARRQVCRHGSAPHKNGIISKEK